MRSWLVVSLTALLPGMDAKVGDLHIKEGIAIGVHDVVAEALGVVGEHVQAAGVEDLVQLGDVLLGLGAGDGLGLENGALGLTGVEGRGHSGGRHCDLSVEGVCEGLPDGRGRGDALGCSEEWPQATSSEGRHVPFMYVSRSDGARAAGLEEEEEARRLFTTRFHKEVNATKNM